MLQGVATILKQLNGYICISFISQPSNLDTTVSPTYAIPSSRIVSIYFTTYTIVPQELYFIINLSSTYLVSDQNPVLFFFRRFRLFDCTLGQETKTRKRRKTLFHGIF